MTIKELKKMLEEYDESTEVRYAVFVDDGIIGDDFEVETIGDYTDQEKPYVLLF